MSAVNVAEEMNIALPERAETATAHRTRPFLWSLRREVWENPSLVVAPVAVACFIIVPFLIAAVRYTGHLLVSADNQPLGPVALAALPLGIVAIALGITMVLVAIFYSIDALLSERQDRSLLFWKSLPVSDTITVLSKVAVPILLLPVVTFAVTLAAQLIVFLIENVDLLTHHISPGVLWTGLPWAALVGVTIYAIITATLWYAPIYAWLLLVSALARRAALVWAVLPVFVLIVFEKIAFHTRYVTAFVKYRVSGIFSTAFSRDPSLQQNRTYIPLSDLTPGHFFSSPGLWEGLLFTALAIILIIRIRRSSDPI